MRRVTALLSAVAFVLATTTAFAQKTSFAGTWVREAPAGGAAAGGGGGGGGRGGGGGGWGNEATITQDATTLTVKWMAGREGATPNERVYKLDGTDSKNTMAGRGGGEPVVLVSKATWDGPKLVIKTTQPNGEQTIVVSIEAGKLTLATTNPAREGGTPTTNTITYAKK